MGGCVHAKAAAELSRHSEIQRNIVRGILGAGVLAWAGVRLGMLATGAALPLVATRPDKSAAGFLDI